MPRFAANLTLLYTEQPFLERFDAARQDGFDAVEFQFPYEHPVEVVAAAAREAGLEIAVFNVPAGDFLEGGNGYSSLPGGEASFRDALALALFYARSLRPRCLNVLPGRLPEGASRADAESCFAANLTAAMRKLAPSGARIVVEALNHYDQPRVLFADHSSLRGFLDARAPAVGVQYDVYHQARMGRDVLADLQRDLPRIGHVQFADAPDRHEPGSGALPFDALFDAVDALGYEAPLGAEYVPAGDTRASLGWLRARRAPKSGTATAPT